jgi:hypothetical protein
VIENSELVETIHRAPLFIALDDESANALRKSMDEVRLFSLKGIKPNVSTSLVKEKSNLEQSALTVARTYFQSSDPEICLASFRFLT